MELLSEDRERIADNNEHEDMSGPAEVYNERNGAPFVVKSSLPEEEEEELPNADRVYEIMRENALQHLENIADKQVGPACNIWIPDRVPLNADRPHKTTRSAAEIEIALQPLENIADKLVGPAHNIRIPGRIRVQHNPDYSLLEPLSDYQCSKD